MENIDDARKSPSENNSSETKSEGEPPAKKSKVAEEALKKIEAAKLLKEKEKQEAEIKAKEELKKELAKLWKPVKDDPSDFTGWTHLLQFVDSKNEEKDGEEAFTTFLRRYPYCYGYWKKFADFQKRNGNPAKVMDIFSQGIAAIPLSTDLWIHYLNHCRVAKKDDFDFIRCQYNRAISECGREWRSDKLWDHYMKWELEVKNLPAAFLLYKDMLKVPTHGLARNMESFESFLKEHNPKDLLEPAEFLNLRKAVIESTENTAAGSESVPGENVEEDLMTSEETQAIRDKILAEIKQIYKVTETKMNSRLKYEEGIKRPYFHVKPLERGQLKNWNEYIEFMKKELSNSSIEVIELEIVYERALIACALYEEFWINYIKWWEDKEGDNIDKIRSVFKRACENHLPTKIDLHERWAAFEEQTGNLDSSRNVLENLGKAHPELINLVLRRISLERRCGNNGKVRELFESAISNASKKEIASELSIKYARFLRLHQMNPSKAQNVIKDAMDTDPTNPKLYLQFVDILINTHPVDVDQVVSILEKAMEQEISVSQKFLFSQRKVEFLEDFGKDMKTIQTARLQHKEYANSIKDTLEREVSPKGDQNGTATNGATITYPPTTSSSSYSAQQNQAYNNYGARYGSFPPNYGQQGGTGY